MFSKQSQEYRKVCTYWKRPLSMRQRSRRNPKLQKIAEGLMKTDFP